MAEAKTCGVKSTVPVTIISTKVVSKLLGIDLYRVGGTGLFSEVHKGGTRGNGHQLLCGRILVRCQETVFYNEGTQTGAQGGCGITVAGDTQN